MPPTAITRIEDLVVVEIAGSVAGSFATKLLGDLGATVVTIEPAGGSPLRRDAAQWVAFATSRQCVADGSAQARSWLASADVVVRSDAGGPVQQASPPEVLRDDVITVDISPFGSTGPYARWRSADIVDQAIAGHLYLSGSPDREPLQGPSGQAALAAGVWAAIGILSALIERDATGTGQHVEATHHEALAALHQFTDVRWTHARNILKRMGNRYAGPGSPIGMYRAADGWVAFTVATAAHGEMLLAVTGLSDLLELPGVSSVTDVMVNASILDPALNGWLATQTVEEAVDLLQSVRIAVGPVLTMTQVLDDPHLSEREWWREAEVDGVTVRLPGPPVRIGSLPWSAEPSPGSTESDDNAMAAQAPAELRATADATPNGGVATADSRTSEPSATPSASRRPLDGVRVLDLTRVWAGPLAARVLSDLGAEVVMVEALWQRAPRVMPQSYVDVSHFFPDDIAGEQHWNRQGFVNKFALGKKSIGLDMATEAGRSVFERLVAAADVVIENFSPRVMPNLGFDEHRLHEINPHLIYLTMPGYGRTGPASDYSAYGPVLDSHAGLSTLMGYPGVDAWKCGIAWPDPVGGIHGAFAVLSALQARNCDPERRGTTIEVAQFETAVSMIADRLVRAQIDGRDPDIIGNRHPELAPHGVYRSAGDDRWLALAVTDDDAWRALRTLIGAPESWGSWGVDQRRAEHDRIDEAITAWSAGRSDRECAASLQAAGVAAAHVADAQDLVEDVHLAHRQFFTELTHPVAGTQRWHGLACRLSETPAQVRSAAPCLGEHNRDVLSDWAGMTDDEIDALLNDGIIGTEPPE